MITDKHDIFEDKKVGTLLIMRMCFTWPTRNGKRIGYIEIRIESSSCRFKPRGSFFFLFIFLFCEIPKYQINIETYLSLALSTFYSSVFHHFSPSALSKLITSSYIYDLCGGKNSNR